MSRCLSKTEIARLMSGQADKSLTATGLQHLESCGACRKAALETEEFQLAASSLKECLLVDMTCLSYEQLAAYLAGELSQQEASTVEAHIAACEDCEQDVALLKQEESHASLRPYRVYGPSKPPLRRQVSFRAIIGVGLAGAAAATVFLTLVHPPKRASDVVVARGPQRPSISTPGRSIHKPPAGAPNRQPVRPSEVVRDGAYTIAAAGPSAGTVSETASGERVLLPSSISEALKAKLKTGKAAPGKPVVVAMADTDILRGSDETGGLEPMIMRPWGTNVPDRKPTLSWLGPERADGFVAQVFTAEGEKMWESPVDSTTCQVAVPLERGRVYLWRVGTIIGDETFYSKAVGFRVLAQEQADTVYRVTKQYADSNLVKGVTLEHYGLYDEALAEFQTLAQRNPKSETARRMLAGLEETMKEARK